MSEREDVEQLGIEILSRTGVGVAGVVTYWSHVVIGLLGAFGERLSEERRKLAGDVFERWGMAMPLVMYRETVPRIWMRSEVAILKGYFGDTLAVIGCIEASGVVHQKNGVILHEAHEYCEQVVAEVDRLSVLGDLTTEMKTFETLVYHCKQLLCVVLGEPLADEFARRYDEAITVMNATVGLVTAPRV